jgi:mono/diheme cytochrome c family protein
MATVGRERRERKEGVRHPSVLRVLSVPLCASAVKRPVFVCVLAVVLGACRQDMHDAPRYEPYEKSDFFADKRSARPLVAGTVARGHLKEPTPETTGKVGSGFVATLPVPVTMDLMRRGRQRYDIFCSPCHGLTGAGDGMVVQRGFRPPTSLHDPRLRAQPDGYLFDVITNGFGAMPDYAAQVPIADRWAVVAYIRALQLSSNATLADVPADRRGELDGAAAPAPQGAPAAGKEPR